MKKSEIMKRAWQLYKEAGCKYRYEFSIALKAAWAEFKTPKKSMEELLVSAGAKRWCKGDHDRIYLNDSIWKLIDITDDSREMGMTIAGLRISKSKGRMSLQYLSKGFYDVNRSIFTYPNIVNSEVASTVLTEIRRMAA